MATTEAFVKRDEMIAIVNGLVDAELVNIKSIRKNARGMDYGEESYPSLIIDIVGSDNVQNASVYAELDSTYNFILMDYLDDFQDDEAIDTKKKALHIDVKTISDAVIDFGQVVGNTEFAELTDGSNIVTAIAWTIKR